MPIATVPIPREDVAKTLDLEESHFLDLKAVEIAPAKLTKSLSAFANADGGELFVGIDEGETKSRNRRAWRGFASQEAANSHIQVFESLFPLGAGPPCLPG